MACNCKICQRHDAFAKHLVLIEEAGLKTSAEFFEEIYSSLNGTELDYQVDEAIIKNQWPSAEEVMKEHGWTRQT